MWNGRCIFYQWTEWGWMNGSLSDQDDESSEKEVDDGPDDGDDGGFLPLSHFRTSYLYG